MRTRLLQDLAHDGGVAPDQFECVPHFEVTEEHHPDAVARLGYFPNIQNITINLDLPVQPAFAYHEDNDRYEYAVKRRSTLLEFDYTALEAAFTLTHLTFLALILASGDCLHILPWEVLTNLNELHVEIKGRVAQGTFGFLPRLASLEVLRADIDFFSVRGLRFLTHLTNLDMTVAPPEGGYLTVEQAQDRNDEALLQITKLPKLQHLSFVQPVSEPAIARLAGLPALTALRLRLPYQSGGVMSMSPWQVQQLFQQHAFGLQSLHYEFRIGAEYGLATLCSTALGDDRCSSSQTGELQFSVPWSAVPIYVKPLGGSAWR